MIQHINIVVKVCWILNFAAKEQPRGELEMCVCVCVGGRIGSLTVPRRRRTRTPPGLISFT